MNLFIQGKNLHHAYCIVGETNASKKEVEDVILKQLKFPIAGNPDFYFREFDNLKAEDTEAIFIAHANRPTREDKKIFILKTNFITEQAQNKLLKIFEEPRGDTHFFLLMPIANNLITTLKSRLFIINSQDEDANHSHKNANDSQEKNINAENIAKEFLNSPIKKRLEIIKDLMEEIKDEEKSKIEVMRFINSLEGELIKRIAEKSGTNAEARGKILNQNRVLFEQIEKIRSYASEQSPSLKMLLEYLALTI